MHINESAEGILEGWLNPHPAQRDCQGLTD